MKKTFLSIHTFLLADLFSLCFIFLHHMCVCVVHVVNILLSAYLSMYKVTTSPPTSLILVN